jgi:hypothetical protein
VKEEKPAEKVEAKPGRYDQDPDWQRIIKERDEARIEKARLEGELKATSKTVEPEKPVELPYKDTNKMTPDQIREWQEDDPQGFYNNLVAMTAFQTAQAVRTELSSKTAREREQEGLKKNYEEFESKHKDFKALWDSGEIIKFIEKNPGENPKSAYFAMTLESKLKEAVDQAKKEAEEEVTKRFLAKRKATSLTGGPAGVGTVDDPLELQNTKQHGGRTAVLADRLAASRRASGR